MTTQPDTIPSPTANELAAEARRNAANARRFQARATHQAAAIATRARLCPDETFTAAIATAAQLAATIATRYAKAAAQDAIDATHRAANTSAIHNTAHAATASDMVNQLFALAAQYRSL